MGKPKEPNPAKLFMSLIASDEGLVGRILEDLSLNFGRTDFISERYPFDFTGYYFKEMGGSLFRRFATFEKLIAIPQLPDIKRTTNGLEEKYLGPDQHRRVNIDPGYLCLEHVILATTKGYSHRPYLREGIFADLTLMYRDKSYRALEWTYPDYRQDDVIALFNGLRKKYSEDLKGRGNDPC
jgi:hypothetical protein